MMKYGLAAMILSIVCLIGSLMFATPVWVNFAGMALGIIGLVILGKASKGGGA